MENNNSQQTPTINPEQAAIKQFRWDEYQRKFGHKSEERINQKNPSPQGLFSIKLQGIARQLVEQASAITNEKKKGDISNADYAAKMAVIKRSVGELGGFAKAVKNDGTDRRLIFTALQETFLTYLKVSFFTAFFVTCPFILMQIWKFIAPGLYKHEKVAILPYLVLTPILFFLGGMLVYYLIMPLAIKFFLSFESTGMSTSLPIQLEAKVNEYLSLVMKLIFAFGISFQLPIVLSLLARIGVVDSKFLKERRKYVVVIIFAAAALLTPPDPITQIGLAIPLLILYELSIFSVKFIENKNLEKTDA